MLKEKIIYAPSLNQADFLKSLAIFNKNTFGIRIFNSYSLLEYGLSKRGIINNDQIITDLEQKCIIYNLIENELKYDTSSFIEASHLADSINELRKERIDINTLKNETLKEVYNSYTQYKQENNLTDAIDYIEKSIELLGTFSDCEIIKLNDFDYSKLDEELLSKFVVKEESIYDCFNIVKQSKEIKSLTAAYGESNEIENIVKYIVDNKLNYDECAIVTPNSSYEKIIYNVLSKYNIPTSYTFKFNAGQSNAYNLLELLESNRRENNSVEELDSLLSAPFFNKIKFYEFLGVDPNEMEHRRNYENLCKLLGHFRFSSGDRNYNLARLQSCFEFSDKVIELYKKYNVEKILNENLKFNDFKDVIYKYLEFVDMDYSDVINQYCICNNQYQEQAKKSILDFIATYTKYGNIINRSITEVIKNIGLVNVASKNSLIVSDLNYSYVRPHIFLCGLDNSFPGRSKENYLCYDKELIAIDNKCNLISTTKIDRKKRQFFNYIEFINSLDVNLHISYASFLVADYKKNNSSSLIYTIYQKYNNPSVSYKEFMKQFKNVGYETRLSNDSILINEVLNNKTAKFSSDVAESKYPVANRTFSPSAINTYFDCPRKFYYKNILYLNEPLEYNRSDYIKAAEFGTLAHEIVQALYEIDFTNIDEYRDYYIDRVALEEAKYFAYTRQDNYDFIQQIYTIAEDQFNYKQLYCSNITTISEEEIQAEHESGIILKGFPDSVRIKDGNAIIVDYKTGNKITHKYNDIGTCLQTIIYCYILENAPQFKDKFTVDHSEYHYLKMNKVITCKYDDEMKKKLAEKLLQFKNSLESGDYPMLLNKKGKLDKAKCNGIYCKFYNICSKAMKENDDD